MKISVTWEMQGSVNIDAPTVEEAMEIFLDNRDTIPLPNDGEYIEGTFNLGSDDPEIQKMFTEIPDEESVLDEEDRKGERNEASGGGEAPSVEAAGGGGETPDGPTLE